MNYFSPYRAVFLTRFYQHIKILQINIFLWEILQNIRFLYMDDVKVESQGRAIEGYVFIVARLMNDK